METLMALHPSYTFTTTLPFNKIETFGSNAEGKVLTFELTNPRRFAVCFATNTVNGSAILP